MLYFQLSKSKHNLAREVSGVDITPQRLRELFCEIMGRLGVPDRYIDAFCGRVPKSVLAQRYTDYSPRKLMDIYEKTNMRIGLEDDFETVVIQ